LNRFFSGAACHAMRPRIEAITDELMDAVEPARRLDVVWDIASPLHFAVVSEMLFGERLDVVRLKQWSTDIWSFVGAGAPTGERAERAATSCQEMSDVLHECVRRRRESPRDDVASALLAPDEQGNVLDPEEATATCLLLLSIGHEATWDTITN